MLLRIILLLNMAYDKCAKYSFLKHQINAHNNVLKELMSLSVVLMSTFVRLVLDSSVSFRITFFDYFPLVISVFCYDYFRITKMLHVEK